MGTFLKFLEEATTDTSGNNATSPNFNANKVATYGMEMDNASRPASAASGRWTVVT